MGKFLIVIRIYKNIIRFPICTWIGLTDKAEESVFRWLNNAPLNYNGWISGQPNGHVEQNCGALDTHGTYDDFSESGTGLLILCSNMGKLDRRKIKSFCHNRKFNENNEMYCLKIYKSVSKPNT